MTEHAWAKLNISLDVCGRLPGGYHSVRTVMQTASLRDDVDVALRGDGRIVCRTNLRYLPSDGRNIAAKAAAVFFRELGGGTPGADIHIHKRIPVCAGLGGGSSDGAAVLRALNALTGRPFDAGRLRAMAGELGSDVPFCVTGGAALGEGRGELLSPLPNLPDCAIVISKPEAPSFTPELFARIDARRSRARPDTGGLIAALERGDLPGVSRRMFNVFEDVLPRDLREVPVIKGRLLDAGALGVTMSGTGSAVFGIFEDGDAAGRARDALLGDYASTFLCRPVGELAV